MTVLLGWFRPGGLARWIHALAWFGLVVVFSGCAGRHTATLVHRSADLEVYLVRAVGEAEQPVDGGYQHPLSLKAAEAGRLLRAIQIHQAPSLLDRVLSTAPENGQPAFSEAEANAVAAGVAPALERATDVDRVWFKLRHHRHLFDKTLTTGVVFAKDDRLHFVLVNYRYNPAGAGPGQEIGTEDPLERRDGRRLQIVPGPFQALHEPDRSSLQGRWVVIDYRGLLDADQVPGGLTSPAPVMEEKSGSRPVDPEQEIERKLDTLKRWYDQGLITEEEYRMKKQEILEAF